MRHRRHHPRHRPHGELGGAGDGSHADAASKSYSIEVARLAGLPGSVIQTAPQHIATQQSTAQYGSHLPHQGGLFDTPPQAAAPVIALEALPAPTQPERTPSAAEEKLATLNPDDLSPREALQALYELKRLV